MKILFILALIALAVFAVSSIIKERRYTKITRMVSCSLAVVLSLVSAIAAPYLRSLGIGVAVLTAASFGLSIFARQFKNDGIRSFVKYTANAILVILLLEAVCFNFNSYHLWKGGYDETPLDMSAATLTNVTQNGNTYVTNGEQATIEFPSLDQKIGTIRLDLNGTAYKTDYSIDFADETNASYYLRTGLVKGSVFNDIKQTKTVVCDFSGKVSKLKINLTELKSNTVTISGITLNTDYPSHFSYLRFALILLGVMFVWAFKRSVNFRKPLGDHLKTTKTVTAVIVIVMVAIALILASVGLNPKTDFNDPTGNQITKELVDRGGAERVGGAEHHLLALRLQLRGQFADGRGLAHAVDADHHDDIGFLREVERRRAPAVGRRVEQGDDLFAEIAVDFLNFEIFVAGDAFLQAFDDALGGLHPHIGRDQHLFERVEHLIVHHALAGHGIGKFLEQRALGLLQPAVQRSLLRLVFLLPVEKSHITKVYKVL